MSPVGPDANVQLVPERTLKLAAPATGSLLQAISDDPQALVYFLLNVGDGDTQLLLLPARDATDVRRLIVVDVATSGKLPALLESLHDGHVLTEPPGTPGQMSLLVATHPHDDHIGGMPDLLERYKGPKPWIDEFWEPGYYFPGPSFHNLMRQLEETHACVRRLQPTSGATMYLDAVKLTVMGPGVNLRNRFDTYGVGINDASITLMVEYPAATIYKEQDSENPGRQNRRGVHANSRRLLLGADAQFTSWAQATLDFPDLSQEYNPVLAKELRAVQGRDYLAADVFKLSHHGSKHGVNIELMERIEAAQTLISATDGGGRYRFPHLLAMEAAREAREATATKRTQHASDCELGIHLTGARLEASDGPPLGSIAVLLPRASRNHLRMFRLMDGRKDDIDLAAAREVKL
jgi:beta-lactamase superfamily II metal-dependent hydrolase